MGKILKYIEGNGAKYQCFKTKKMLLDTSDNDTIAYNYDDNYDFRETSFSDIVKCEMALLQED
ncbi:MAG: hypothetical protein LBE11_05020, partial [Prevotellaceae bacterium]|nr:hypothetical protein [Prevotellaceae bacterium]